MQPDPEICGKIEDLQCRGLKIIQNPGRFMFGMDAVLLSDFVKVRKGDNVLDLCTGTGIIPLLLWGKYSPGTITAIEIQRESAELAKKSMAINGLQDKITVMNFDANNIGDYLPRDSFDIVTCNPPYMELGRGLENPNGPMAIARHEICITLEQVITAAKYALKPGKSFFMVHRPGRLPEILGLLQKHRLEPKRMRLVYPYIDREPNMLLIEASLGGKRGMRIEAPLIVYSEKGKYTQEVNSIYSGEKYVKGSTCKNRQL